MLPWILAFSLSAAPMEESDPGTAGPSAVSPPQGQGETWPYQTRSVGTGGSKPDLS
jgi:hypothetical protein